MNNSSKFTSLRRALALRCLLAVAAAPLVQAAPADAPAAESKTHTLFMGADILVEQGKESYRVEDVVGGSFVIKVNGREVKVPASFGKVKMRVDRSLKLTASSVAIDRLKTERAYTPANDPVKIFMRQQGEVMAAEDAVAASAANLGAAQVENNAAHHTAGAGPGGPEMGMPTMRSVVGSERGLSQAGAASYSAFGRDAGFVGSMQDELAKQLYDAISVEFDVSSPKPLPRPYVVIMAQFHSIDAKPDESQNWLYAAALDPLEGKPQKVRVHAGGFPPGYVLEKCQVHVYDSGQEVATSVSEKQVALTRTEAFAYLLLNYVGTHKGATLPASPALGKSAEARARLSAEQLKQTYFVKVSKDGLPVAAFLDADLSQPVDPTVGSLISEVRFYPALDNGKAVDGSAQLKLTRLPL